MRKKNTFEMITLKKCLNESVPLKTKYKRIKKWKIPKIPQGIVIGDPHTSNSVRDCNLSA